jgi:hypothetical protein
VHAHITGQNARRSLINLEPPAENRPLTVLAFDIARAQLYHSAETFCGL